MIRRIIAPLVAAFIWGTAFVAQRVAADDAPAFAFNALRSLVAVVTLAVILLISKQFQRRRHVEEEKHILKDLLLGGLCCGTITAIAAGLQQMGLEGTDSGKAGFITALYIVLVPILGLFLGRKASVLTAISVAISVAGMYLLCVKENFTFQKSDVQLILCALCFAVQILCIDHFAPKTNTIALSLAQFAVMAVESALLSLLLEGHSTDWMIPCLIPILYVGIFSSGVAYTLQIVAQKGSDPTVVSLLLSLESVFSAVAGALVLHEAMSGREYLGCALMLMAVVLSQLPVSWFRRKISAQ